MEFINHGPIDKLYVTDTDLKALLHPKKIIKGWHLVAGAIVVAGIFYLIWRKKRKSKKKESLQPGK